MDNLLGIELHDAEVETVELRRDGTLIVRFLHVFGVVQETDTRLGGWSFTAEVGIEGVLAVSLEVEGDQPVFGRDPTCATVWNAVITGTDANYDDVLPPSLVVSDATVLLTFAPLGAQMQVRGKKLTLEVLARNQRIEDVVDWP